MLTKACGYNIHIQEKFPSTLRYVQYVDINLFEPLCRVQWNQYVILVEESLIHETQM